MAYFPPIGSIVAYQIVPSSLLTGASIIGLPPVNVVGNPSISGTVNVGNTITINPPSVSGTVGASVIGLPPVRLSDGSETLDIYEENQADASVTGVAIMWKSNVDTSILSAVTHTTPLPVSVRGVVGVSGNPSISGQVGASVIGHAPVVIVGGSVATSTTNSSVMLLNGANVIGSVTVLQGTNPFIITGSIQGGGAGTEYAEDAVVPSVTGTAIMFRTNQSSSIMDVVNPSSPLPVSVIGTPNVNVAGSVVAFQGAGWSGSVAALITNTNVNISGSVAAFKLGTWITSLVSTIPSSVIVGTSIFGQLPAGTAPLGSVATLQGTNPWNIAGSVAAFQAGTRITSISGAIGGSSSVYVMRNDAVASFLGADLTVRPAAGDSAGRTLIKPFAAEESRIEGVASVVHTSVTTLVAAAGAGLRNYITDIALSNGGSVATTVTFRSQGGTSILGNFIVPSGGGNNKTLLMPIRTLANETFDFQASNAVSVLYANVSGFKAP